MRKAFTIFCYATLGALGLMALFDLLFFIKGGPGETLSYQFWVLAKQYPFIPLLLGILVGHLCWQYNPDSIKPS